jgi:nicotinamide phosphoribosyltransferase
MRRNLILMTDSYKYSHSNLYPPGTQSLYSYLESRGGKYDSTVFFGLQYLLSEYLTSGFSLGDIKVAADFCAAHGEPFDQKAWTDMYHAYDGQLPLRIDAVKEGTVVPTHNVLLSCESTDYRFYWLSSWIETVLCRLWYPITVATQSHEIKKTILSYLKNTADDAYAEINFKLHDFGARGVSSSESAGIGGMAHLVNFMGSDTVEGIRYAQEYYGCGPSGDGMPAFSIPATEHSTITSWGRENEEAAYANVVKQFAKPGALFACVSDSYDLYAAIDHFWTGSLRKQVEESGATLVIRPDSGDPVEVVDNCIRLLERKVGMTHNSKGYKVLPKWVRLIQGDGINHESIKAILERLQLWGYSASNIAFGMGGALLQGVNRDTQKFAYKCSEAMVNDTAVPVFKDPVTDQGKRSKQGRLALIKTDSGYQTESVVNVGPENNLLEKVFWNGQITRRQNFDEVRKLAAGYL